jgi:hypothetical protein
MDLRYLIKFGKAGSSESEFWVDATSPADAWRLASIYLPPNYEIRDIQEFPRTFSPEQTLSKV